MIRKPLLIGAVDLVRARVRDDGKAIVSLSEELGELMKAEGLLDGAPFETVHLIIRYGTRTAERPEIGRIIKKYSELTVAIEVAMEEVHRAPYDQLFPALRRATLKALIGVAEKYRLPADRWRELLAEIPTPDAAARPAAGPRCSTSDVVETDQQQTMPKLYFLQNGRVLAYHEAWIDGLKVMEHWGPLGERGQTREHHCGGNKAKGDVLKEVLAEPLKRGYRPIELDDHAVLLIEYCIDGMGTDEDLDKRHALEDRMKETLGWTGLGHCDGGSIGSGTMEVCCYVVDFEAARRVVAKDLDGTPFADYSRIYWEDED